MWKRGAEGYLIESTYYLSGDIIELSLPSLIGMKKTHNRWLFVLCHKHFTRFVLTEIRTIQSQISLYISLIFTLVLGCLTRNTDNQEKVDEILCQCYLLHTGLDLLNTISKTRQHLPVQSLYIFAACYAGPFVTMTNCIFCWNARYNYWG